MPYLAVFGSHFLFTDRPKGTKRAVVPIMNLTEVS